MYIVFRICVGSLIDIIICDFHLAQEWNKKNIEPLGGLLTSHHSRELDFLSSLKSYHDTDVCVGKLHLGISPNF